MGKVRRDEQTFQGSVDVEQQFVLRLPLEPAAENLRKDLQSSSFKDKLSIEIHPELRKGRVTYDGQMYNAKLYDMPCVIESYKTTDRKTFYKTADISQLLLCSTDFDDENLSEEDTMKKKDKDKKFNWSHGLCPPHKNVRRRRFRKIVHKKNPEQPDIDRELKRLFATDAQAIDVKWEVIDEEEESQISSANQNKGKLSAGGGRSSADDNLNGNFASTNRVSSKNFSVPREPMDDSLIEEGVPLVDDGLLDNDESNNIAEQDIFGVVSSSEEEDEAAAADVSAANDREELMDDEGGDNFEPTNQDEGQTSFQEEPDQGSNTGADYYDSIREFLQ